jgi:Rrf2 family protein
LAALAAANGNGPIPVRKLAQGERISAKYLEHILLGLNAAGLVRASRGKRGGYALAKPAEQITLREVFEAMEGPVAPVECVDDRPQCAQVDDCPARDTWVELKEAVVQVLERTTVGHLAGRKHARNGSSPFQV